ncbi:hypothetical protein DRO69_01685 [Candidatus Bathyarchaeota archaeon]|nr:MAG: hypothetical protein DRO69_01685 [Candidatus Bathyarchaeota archaeon]
MLGLVEENINLSKLGKKIGRVIHKVKKAEKPEIVEEKPSSSTPSAKAYLKALPLRDLEDVDVIKQEVKSGNILILRVGPLARKSVEDVKRAVSELYEFTQLVGGDIARLGEERVVITPSTIRIWREKKVSSKQRMPTAA